MKKILAFLLFSTALLGADVANDAVLQQVNPTNTGLIERHVQPAANSLLGFDGSKAFQNVTIGGGLQLSGGILSSTLLSGDNALTGQNTFSLRPVQLFTALSTGSQTVTVNTNYYVTQLNADLTLTFSGTPTNDAGIFIDLAQCDGTHSVIFPSSMQRVGDPTGLTNSITPSAGRQWILFRYINGAWIYVDSTSASYATLSGNNTFTGQNTFPGFNLTGAVVAPPASMLTTTVDVTKARIVRSLTADETEVFSATPATGTTVTVEYSADNSNRTVTPDNGSAAVWFYDLNTTGTSFVVPANTTKIVTYERLAASWIAYGTGVPTIGSGSYMLSSLSTGTIIFQVGDGNSVVATGEKIPARLYVPFACTLTGYAMFADASATADIIIYKDASYPASTNVTGTAKPTLTAASSVTSGTINGSTISVAAGSYLGFYVNSNDTAKFLKLIITYTRP